MEADPFGSLVDSSHAILARWPVLRRSADRYQRLSRALVSHILLHVQKLPHTGVSNLPDCFDLPREGRARTGVQRESEHNETHESSRFTTGNTAA